MSTSRIRRPRAANSAPRASAVELFPTPPFWSANTRVGMGDLLTILMHDCKSCISIAQMNHAQTGPIDPVFCHQVYYKPLDSKRVFWEDTHRSEMFPAEEPNPAMG